MNDQELGQTAYAWVAKSAIARGVTLGARLAEIAHRARGGFDGLEVTRNLAYGTDPAQRLDVWRSHAPSNRPRAVVLFFHGGGFQHLHKESHWVFAERFARAGAVVFNADYRLAPEHRYPAAADDAERAYQFVREHAASYGGDLAQLVVSGTSAGGNLALGVAVTHPTEIAGVAQFSGLLQVSDMPRFYRARSMSKFLRARVASIGCDYPAKDSVDAAFGVPKEADPRFDPLLYLERLQTLPARFPATYISTGSADQVLEDNLRLYRCLQELGMDTTLDVEPGGGHSFQGFLRANVIEMWERCFAFYRSRGLQLSSARSSGAAS